jgi:hypothetical protein
MYILKDLKIEGTTSSPSVCFHADGTLKIEGRSMSDNPAQTFEPLLIWVENLIVDRVVFDIQLDYLNTSSSKQLLSLLQLLDENDSIHELIVNWHYEVDDEDHYETGMIFQERLHRAKFNYLSFA